MNDIDTSPGAEYIVIIKLKAVSCYHERNSGRNSKQEKKGGYNEKNEFNEVRDGGIYDFDDHGLGFHSGLASMERTQSRWKGERLHYTPKMASRADAEVEDDGGFR
jgi:hypothetical protein